MRRWPPLFPITVAGLRQHPFRNKWGLKHPHTAGEKLFICKGLWNSAFSGVKWSPFSLLRDVPGQALDLPHARQYTDQFPARGNQVAQALPFIALHLDVACRFLQAAATGRILIRHAEDWRRTTILTRTHVTTRLPTLISPTIHTRYPGSSINRVQVYFQPAMVRVSLSPCAP